MENHVYPLLGLGMTFWFLSILWGLYLLFLCIWIPLLIFRISKETRETKEILSEISTRLFNESAQKQDDKIAPSAKAASEQPKKTSNVTLSDIEKNSTTEEPTFNPGIQKGSGAEETPPIFNPDIKNPKAEEIPYKNDDDLRYAPPEYRK